MSLYGYIVVILTCICCSYACHVMYQIKKQMDDHLIFVMHHVYELQKSQKFLIDNLPQIKARAQVEEEINRATE